MLLNFGIAVYLGNSRIPQFFKTVIWRLMDGHGDGAVVTALTSASNEALLPQIGQAPTWLPGKLSYAEGWYPALTWQRGRPVGSFFLRRKPL